MVDGIRDALLVQQCPAPVNNSSTNVMINIRVSLFFDGTLNNRNNTSERARTRDRPWLNSTSWTNDYSNISKLEQFASAAHGVDHFRPIYIEGIGTTDLSRDSPLGTLLGMDTTGVKDKVSKALRLVIELITCIETDKVIDHIYIDVFGFSRGAAAARYFIYFAIQQDRLKNRLDRVVNHIDVKFVGLFDTVAAHGIIHINDTHELHLHSIRIASKVVQLAAADEYRENFPLTNINSAHSNGLQIFLPGVHSDIGGGYRHNFGDGGVVVLENATAGAMPEDQTPANAARLLGEEKERLIEAGWFNRSELTPHNIGQTDFGLVANRACISNKYDRIPLFIMAEKAQQEGLIFNITAMESRYGIPPSLHDVKRAIYTHIADVESGSVVSTTRSWRENTPMLKQLRHGYLHWSSNFGSIGMAPLPVSIGCFYGTRDRRIFHG